MRYINSSAKLSGVLLIQTHDMFYTAFRVLIILFLVIVCWMGGTAVVHAQPSPSLTGKTLFSFSGKRPTELGVKQGQFAPCPESPNCVSSQSPTTDSVHAIDPLTYTSAPETAMTTLKTIINGMARTKIITETSDYLYAEFKSALMGFVDDVEFFLDPSANVIQVRSASRLGQSDLGVNRKRIEDIRAAFAALDAKTN